MQCYENRTWRTKNDHCYPPTSIFQADISGAVTSPNLCMHPTLATRSAHQPSAVQSPKINTWPAPIAKFLVTHFYYLFILKGKDAYIYVPTNTMLLLLYILGNGNPIFSFHSVSATDVLKKQHWWLWRSSSCRWGETTSLNCGHQRDYCSSPRDTWAWKTTVEWYRQGKTRNSSTRSFW
jgi:hypothetical protein